MITQKRHFLKNILKLYKSTIKGRLLDVGGPSNFDKDNYKISSYTSINIVDLEGKTTVIGSVEEMPFASDTFDTVLFIEALPCVENIEKGISECMRVLKPGGFLFVSTLFIQVLADFNYDKHRH